MVHGPKPLNHALDLPLRVQGHISFALHDYHKLTRKTLACLVDYLLSIFTCVLSF